MWCNVCMNVSDNNDNKGKTRQEKPRKNARRNAGRNEQTRYKFTIARTMDLWSI